MLCMIRQLWDIFARLLEPRAAQNAPSVTEGLVC